MELSDLIQKRYAVRGYKPDPVPDEMLRQVLEAARLAPTASNRQPFQLIVIHTQGREAELQRIYQREWFVQAPLLIGACTVRGQGWVHATGKSYTDIDIAIVMDHLILAAASLGLGTCWIAAFNPAAAREVLQLPPEVDPVIFTPLGFPAVGPGPKHEQRKPLSELVRYEHW